MSYIKGLMYTCSFECIVKCVFYITASVNILRPRQNGRQFADDTFKRIFLKENVRISIKISLKFVPKSPIDNIPSLFQIMAWRRPGDKPLSEAMVVSLLTHLCVARSQWVKPVASMHKRRRLTGMGIPIINLRPSDDRYRCLRFIIPVPIRRRLLDE